MKIKIKKLSKDCILPQKQTLGAAAYDIYAPKNILINIGRQVIPMDFALELPKGFEAHIQPRSGYSSKGFEGYKSISGEMYRFDCDVLDGKIDSDYRGNVGVIVNNRDYHFFIKKGQRISQLTIRKVEDVEWEEVSELSETDRGEEGFGSTNTI